jgi:hypothetical protein
MADKEMKPRIRRSREVKFSGGDNVVTKIAKQTASYRINVLIEQKSHEGAPT